MTNQLNIYGRKGGKGGGSGGYTATEDPNTLKSYATARVLEIVSEGEIFGLVDGLKSVLIDGVPIENDDGTFNFNGLQIDFRSGFPNQEHIAGFSAIENEIVVDNEVVYGAPIIRTVTSNDIDAVRVKVVIPKLTKQDTQTGSLHGFSVQYAVDVQPNGGAWINGQVQTVKGKCTSEFEIQHRVNKPIGGTPWNFRVRRVSTDFSESSNINGETHFSSYTEIIDAKLSYPDTALFGVTIDAEQFGDKIPKRAYRVKGLIINVPVNYDPETRTYSGIWNGTFKREYCNNPAWCLYDMITNDRYGLGEFIPVAKVNKGKLYEIAQYCDELVPDGVGGLEPRFTLNVQLRKREDAYALLKKLSSVFRGYNYWASGTVDFTHDAPADPVKLVSAANVIDGKFKYSSKSLRNRYTVAVTTYNNPLDNDRPDLDVYEDFEALNVFGWRQKDINAFGANSRGQAHRVGKWEIFEDQNAITSVRYKCGLDHIYERPGNIIEVYDPTIAGIRLAGRIVSITGNVVVLDNIPNDIPLSYAYEFRYVLPDGSLEARDVITVTASTNTITLTAPATVDPIVGAMWGLRASEISPRLFRVKKVALQKDYTFEIEAEEHLPGKYGLIESGIQFDEGNFTLPTPSGPIESPNGLTTEEYLYKDGSTIKTAVIFSASASPDARVIATQFQYKLDPQGDFENISANSQQSIEVFDIADGEIVQFRARYVDRTGKPPSPWTESAQYVVQGKLTPPSTPTGLTATIRPDTGIVISKDASPDVDYKETKFLVGVTVGGATTLDTIYGNVLIWDKSLAGSLTFWVIDYDTGGRPSTPASVNLTVNAPSQMAVNREFNDGNVVFKWDNVVSDFAIAQYLIYDGEELLQATKSLIWSTKAKWSGEKTFTFIATDIAGNQSTPLNLLVDLNPVAAPSIIGEYINNTVRLSWAVPLGTLPIDHYIVTNNGVATEITQPNIVIPVDFTGSRTISVYAVDTAGGNGSTGSFDINPALPSAATITAQVIDNNVLFRYSAVKGSLPIDFYELKKGADYGSATNFAIKAGNSSFTTLFESAGGIYTYWITAVDTAGNYGLPASIVANVSQPPDYVLFAQYSLMAASWPGTLTNALETPTGTLVLPFDTSETWNDNLSNGYSTLQAEISATFDRWPEPVPTTGSIEHVVDYGAIIDGCLISAATNPDLSEGAPVTVVTLSYSEDNSVWTDGGANQLQLYATNFRYIRVNVTVTGVGANDFIELSDVTIRLDKKIISDAGRGTAASGDSGGTTIEFNTPFIDVSSITVTPQGSTAVIPVYDFVDAPYPTEFSVYLFNTSGTRVSGVFSWSAEGY